MQDFGFSIANNLKVFSQQCSYSWLIETQIRKEPFTRVTEIGEPRVILVVQNVLLEEFPEPLDQIEIRTVRW